MDKGADRLPVEVEASSPIPTGTGPTCRVPRPTTLQDLKDDYGWEATTVTELRAEATAAHDWASLSSVRHKVAEFLTVEPPILCLEDAESLLREIDARLDIPVVGASEDWRSLDVTLRRAVCHTLDRLRRGPQGLSVPPELYRQLSLSEIDGIAGSSLPCSVRDALVREIERHFGHATNRAEPATGATTPSNSAPAANPHLADSRNTVMAGKRPIVVGNQLNPWPDHVRATPDCLVRGALLSPIKTAPRPYRRLTLIGSQNGISIGARGQRLIGMDTPVLDAAVHLGRRQPFGEPIEVTLSGFVRAVGRRDGKKTRSGVAASLRRLARCEVAIKLDDGKIQFSGSFLERVSIYRRRRDGRRCVRYVLPVGLLALYSAGATFTTLNERTAVARSPLAMWLHLFFASHKSSVHAMFVQTYHNYTGMRCTLPEFRRLLANALEALVSARLIRSATIAEDDKVYIKKRLRRGTPANASRQSRQLF